MATISKASANELKRRRAAILAELKEAEPSLMLELEAVNKALEERVPGTGPYSQIRSVIDAVTLHLQTTQKRWTKRELQEGLLAGGYYAGQEIGAYMIRDSINYHIKKGRLTIDKDEKVGLPPTAIK